MTWILAYLAAGTVIGFFAGLLGIGGGMTLVPILAALFTAQQMAPEHVMHLALGTAMAGVLFTGSASVREHHKLGSVDWAVVKRLAPPMATGTLLSSLASGWLPQRVLVLAFAVIVAGAATQIWIGKKPGPGRTLPGALGLWGVGLFIGVVSGLVSAGGAFLSMPFMLWCGVPVRTAIGTGAALGLPVAALGTVGYVASGWPASGLPWGSLGFVLLPALAGVVVASTLTAPVGARLAHRLPVATLRRVFALVLYLLAAKMVFSYT
ncbi:MAG: sulfite exporter TauE/SafE family protein [Betaproteobacteria bacterium]|jgi:uncharacterized membrane protein YfcA